MTEENTSTEHHVTFNKLLIDLEHSEIQMIENENNYVLSIQPDAEKNHIQMDYETESFFICFNIPLQMFRSAFSNFDFFNSVID